MLAKATWSAPFVEIKHTYAPFIKAAVRLGSNRFQWSMLQTGLMQNRFQPKPVWTETGFALFDTMRKPVSDPVFNQNTKTAIARATGRPRSSRWHGSAVNNYLLNKSLNKECCFCLICIIYLRIFVYCVIFVYYCLYSHMFAHIRNCLKTIRRAICCRTMPSRASGTPFGSSYGCFCFSWKNLVESCTDDPKR